MLDARVFFHSVIIQPLCSDSDNTSFDREKKVDSLCLVGPDLPGLIPRVMLVVLYIYIYSSK